MRQLGSVEDCLGLFGTVWDIVGKLVAALYCAVGPEVLMKVIESGSHRWKAHHYQLMKKKRKD
jgi:hypothetical protein